MANFTININNKVVIPYKGIKSVVRNGANCDGDTLKFLLKLANTVSSPNGDIVHLIGDYTGDPIQKIYIKDIDYNNSNALTLMYNNELMLENTEYEIDVSAIDPDTVIPSLVLAKNKPPLTYSTDKISYSISVEDVNTKHGYVDCTVTSLYDECTEVTDPIISDIVRGDCGNGVESVLFTVTHTPNTPLRLSYRTLQNVGVSGRLSRLLDSQGVLPCDDTISIDIIPEFSSVVETEFPIIITDNLVGLYHFKITIDDVNTAGVRVRLLSPDGQRTIYAISIPEL